ncbi:hypothetical protein ACH0B6_20485 [Solibacillus silvestris]
MTTLEQTYLEGLKNYSSSNNLTFQNPVTGAQYTAAEYGHYFGGVEPYLYHDCMLAGLKLLEGNNDFKIHITARDIANLKKEWLSDPIWDIEDTEGFEEVRDELKAFAAEQTAIWQHEFNENARKRRDEEMAIKAEQDDDALQLGLKGMYQLLLKQQQQIKDLQSIMNALVECNDTSTALQIMQCAIADKRWPNESEGGF